jgi:hypothetical protein
MGGNLCSGEENCGSWHLYFINPCLLKRVLRVGWKMGRLWKINWNLILAFIGFALKVSKNMAYQLSPPPHTTIS